MKIAKSNNRISTTTVKHSLKATQLSIEMAEDKYKELEEVEHIKMCYRMGVDSTSITIEDFIDLMIDNPRDMATVEAGIRKSLALSLIDNAEMILKRRKELQK